MLNSRFRMFAQFLPMAAFVVAASACGGSEPPAQPATEASTARRPVSAAPVRARRLTRDLQPSAEVPGLDPSRPVPADLDSPQEPEPPQQVQRIRADRGRRPTRRLQIPQIDRDRLHRDPVDVDEPVGLPHVVRRHHTTGLRHDQSAQIP